MEKFCSNKTTLFTQLPIDFLVPSFGSSHCGDQAFVHFTVEESSFTAVGGALNLFSTAVSAIN